MFQLPLHLHGKQKLPYFAVSESFFVLLMLSLYIYTHNKNIAVFRALTQAPSRALLYIPVNFQHAYCMTIGLKILPYNYWPNEKPLLAALHIYLQDAAASLFKWLYEKLMKGNTDKISLINKQR